MALPVIIERPDVTDGSTGQGECWIVTVFNNDHNTWDQVVTILIAATGCCLEEAQMETWEIDRLGKSVVHHGDREECGSVAEIIAEIGIRVEVSQE